ncbi:MAG: hypothetical protein F4X84_01125 [Synechococcus sp. SB0662_bin_45]|nr:hypothetical protein [Synechococcus sp. SB0668_bin_13]MYE21006.1 hypothetical protein [Synechococcus sp. SB0662_bin_45]
MGIVCLSTQGALLGLAPTGKVFLSLFCVDPSQRIAPIPRYVLHHAVLIGLAKYKRRPHSLQACRLGHHRQIQQRLNRWQQRMKPFPDAFERCLRLSEGIAELRVQALHVPFGSGIPLFCEGQRQGGSSLEECPGRLDYTVR